jgi:membrane protease YdiL (CAAX protease family)
MITILFGEDKSKQFLKGLPSLSIRGIFFLSFLIVIAGVIVEILFPFNSSGINDLNDFLGNYLIYIITLLISYKLIFRSFKSAYQLFNSLNFKEVFKDFILICLPFNILILIVSTASLLNDQKRLTELQELSTQPFYPILGNFFNDWIMFTILYLLIGFTEEVLFRGGIYRGLRKKLSKNWAWIISGLIFYIPHWQFSILGLVSIFGLGLINAWYLEYKNNLMVPSLLHYFQNAFSVGLTTFGSLYLAQYILEVYR